MKKFLFSLIFIQISIFIYSQKLLDFEIKSINGTIIHSDSLKGRLVYINVFETYCIPCIKEFPTLNKLSQEHPDFIFLAITPAKRDKIESFTKKYQIEFEVLPESKIICDSLAVKMFPSHFILDKEGGIRQYNIWSSNSIGEQSNDKANKIDQSIYNQLNQILKNNESKYE